MVIGSLFIVIVQIPYPSSQHFVWFDVNQNVVYINREIESHHYGGSSLIQTTKCHSPLNGNLSCVGWLTAHYFNVKPLHWCLLADICNHTWIPECGTENEEDIYARRLFIDECDMYEYNCDFEADYYAVNYSDCFNVPVTPCPSRPPCPSIPTCPDHRFHRMGDKYKFIPSRRMGKKPRSTTKVTLPMHMLKGKRRYSPTGRKRRRRTRKTTSKITTQETTKKTINKTMRTVILKKEEVIKNGKKFMKIVKGFIKKVTKRDSSDFLE